jgi:hypothetical protein
MRSLTAWKLVAAIALVSILGCGGGGGDGSGGTGGTIATGGTGGQIGSGGKGGSGASAGSGGKGGTSGAAGTMAGAGGAGGTAACVTGNEGCACYGNDTCNGTLRCYSHLCVLVPVDGGAGQVGAGGSGGKAGAGGAAAGASGEGGSAGAGGTAGAGGKAGAGGTAGLAGTSGTGGAAGASGAAGAAGAAGGSAGAGGAGGMCSAGTADCDQSATNGCETNIATDTQNCGGCGVVCQSRANSTVGCANQACTLSSCSPNYKDCNNLEADGCETNVATDTQNCGGCGVICPPRANSVVGCANQACTLSSCNANYKDCNNLEADGCETNIATDPQNCAGCGTICPARSHASPGCASQICTVVCDPNYKDCNANTADGCETNVATDSQNCGGCGVVCAPRANATVGCANQACTLSSCNPNYKDCNSLEADGCETNIATDVANCGGCGNACPTNYLCVAGGCLPPP